MTQSTMDEAFLFLRRKIKKFFSSPKNNITLNNEEASEILDDLEKNKEMLISSKFSLLNSTETLASAYNRQFDSISWDNFGIVCWRYCSKAVLERFFNLLSEWKNYYSDNPVRQSQISNLRNMLPVRSWGNLEKQTKLFIERPRMVLGEIGIDARYEVLSEVPADVPALRILDELQYHFEEVSIEEKISLLKMQHTSVLDEDNNSVDQKSLTFGMVCATDCLVEVMIRYLQLLTEWKKIHPKAVVELLMQVDESNGKTLKQLIEGRNEPQVVAAYLNLVEEIGHDLRYQDETYLNFFKDQEGTVFKLLESTLSPEEYETVLKTILTPGTPLSRFASFSTQKQAAITLDKRMPWVIDCMHALYASYNITSFGKILIDNNLLENILQILEDPSFLTQREKIDLLIVSFIDSGFTTLNFGLIVARCMPDLLERYFKLVQSLVSNVQNDKQEEFELLFLILEFTSTDDIAYKANNNNIHIGMMLTNEEGAHLFPAALIYCELLKFFAEKGLRDRIHKLMLIKEGERGKSFIDFLIVSPSYGKVLIKLLQYGLLPEEQYSIVAQCESDLRDALFACDASERKQIFQEILQKSSPIGRFFSCHCQNLANEFSILQMSRSGFSLVKKKVSHFIFKYCYEPDKTHLDEDGLALLSEINLEKKEEGKEQESDKTLVDADAEEILRELESNENMIMVEKIILLKVMLKFNHFTLFPFGFTAKKYTFAVVCATLCSSHVVLQLLNLLIQWREQYPLSVMELLSVENDFNLLELIRKYHDNKDVLTACTKLVKSTEEECRYYDQEYVNLFRGRDESELLYYLKTFLLEEEYAKALKAILRPGTPLYGYFSFETKKSVAMDLGKMMEFLADCIREVNESLPEQNGTVPKRVENILQVLEDQACLKPKEKIELLRAPFDDNLVNFTTRTFGMILPRYALRYAPRFLDLVKNLAIVAQTHEHHVGVKEKDRIVLDDVFHILEAKATGNSEGVHFGLILVKRTISHEFLISYCRLLDFFAKNGFRERIHTLMLARDAYYNENIVDLLLDRTSKTPILYFLRYDLWPKQAINELTWLEKELFNIINDYFPKAERDEWFEEILKMDTPLNRYFSSDYKEKIKAIIKPGALLPQARELNQDILPDLSSGPL